MSRRRGRPTRRYRVRVRTVRREQIDYDALARAALEEAAMDRQPTQEPDDETPPIHQSPRRRHSTNRLKGPGHDHLA